MNTTKKTKRPYRRITSETVAKHKTAVALTGNNTRAVEVIEPEQKDPSSRGYKIAKKSKSMPTLTYLDEGLQQIASDGLRRLSKVVNETHDERLVLGITRYATDQVRGKAVTKSIAITGKMNIQSVLD